MPNIKDILEKYHGMDYELLLAHCLKRDRVFVLTHKEYILKPKEQKRWRSTLKKYCQGYSVAVIVKNKEFYKLNFFVNKYVLIPRPETEMVVEEALKEITDETIFIDIGTGTGCIPIAIIKNTPKKILTFAIDISPVALRVAKKNAKNILDSHFPAFAQGYGEAKRGNDSKKIKFLLSNLLQKFPKNKLSEAKKMIITANLPYLTEKQFRQEKSIQKEPKIALTAKENGLQLYRLLLQQIQKIHITKPLVILFEFYPTQKQKISTLIKKYLPHAQIEIKKDLAGQDRLAKITAN